MSLLNTSARLQWIICLLSLFVASSRLCAAETIWVEAEHLNGIRGYCWPMGDDSRKMRETDGHWGLSGPGWAAEWNQGGESGFLSIACGAADDRAVATKTIEIPSDGTYFVWVRYGDWREQTERFQIKLEQTGSPAWTGSFGEQAVVEEDNEMKLYWGWAFAWAKQEVKLSKGTAQLSLVSTTQDPQPRQIDLIVLTTDGSYRPLIKERPANETWKILDSYRDKIPAELQPLARSVELRGKAPAANSIPSSWKTRTFRDRGFLYLWNMSHTDASESWLSDKPDRVKVPYNLIDKDSREAFEKKYAGRDDVPIFSDPRVAPTFHGVGAGIFATDPQTGEVEPAGQLFAKWLDQHPDRHWAMMMNYHPGKPIGEKGIAMFQKYRDRYVGSIAGESLGYFYPPADQMQAVTENAKTRRELVAAFTPLTLAGNAEKYRAVYGRDLDQNPYQDVISCLSVGNIVFAPLCFDWGAQTGGYESSTMTSSILNMRMAFMRGAARQHGGLTATYRSCNFGDASTIFSNGGSYHSPQNLLDNYYSVFSGAGMTWYKFDIWYQYMCGSSMFYHEQGFDEFWRPGGTTAAGIKEIQLSPKGKLVDRFLRLTAAEPDRGSPYTPVAFLVDYAHGWEPAPFWPNSFKNWHGHQDRFLFGDHEKMLEEWFWTAYYPIGPESEKPITGTNEVYLPAVFGDIFDVIYAYPDVTKWRTIETYPVVIANGEIELTDDEGKRLAKYVNDGGTLLVADAHLSGPGLNHLNLPAVAESRQASAYRWHLQTDNAAEIGESPAEGFSAVDQLHASARFRFQPILAGTEKLQVIASSDDDLPICAAIDRGQGRLVYLSIPKGLTISQQAHPIVARLMAHLTRGLMPVEVDGDVQWMLNKTEQGWAVTLLNPAGQAKPQQGITPTDFRENRSVQIRSQWPITNAHDRLLPSEKIEVHENSLQVTVPAGAVRIIEIK
jgi:hypothetical protein